MSGHDCVPRKYPENQSVGWVRPTGRRWPAPGPAQASGSRVRAVGLPYTCVLIQGPGCLLEC